MVDTEDIKIYKRTMECDIFLGDLEKAGRMHRLIMSKGLLLSGKKEDAYIDFLTELVLFYKFGMYDGKREERKRKANANAQPCE